MSFSFQSEKLFVLVPAMVMTLTAMWTGAKARDFPPRERERVNVIHSNLHQAQIVALPDKQAAGWQEPKAQAKGAKWIFELFTPPEIFFDPQAKQFVVIPPTSSLPSAAVPVSRFGIKLLGLRRDPYRLQLVGYVGDGSNASGMFENVETTEHFLAQSGRHVPGLGLTIREFSVKRKRVDGGNETSWYEPIAEAVIRDEIAGEDHVLSNQVRSEGGAWIAVFELSHDEENGRTFEAREGENYTEGTQTYAVDSIRSAPISVTVSKTMTGSSGSETRTLLLQ